MPPFALPISNQFISPPRETNDCGECSACCDILGIAELGKPSYARCRHLTCNCTIYASRPPSCREYRCAWHAGLLGDRPELRPDRVGLMLNLDPRGGLYKIGVHEVIPGALDQVGDRLKHIISRIRSHRAMKKVTWAPISVGYYPFGAETPCDYPISSAYSPYVPPSDHQMAIDKVRGEATYSGACHELLMPKNASENTP